MKPTIISFVRHGHVYNPEGVVYGRLPRFRLSGAGVKQSQFASEFFAGKTLAAVFTSPLLRARQTARVIITKHNHLSLHLSQLLNEVHGPFDGHPFSTLSVRNWDVYTGAPVEYEQPKDVHARTQKFILNIRRKYLGEHIVAVTHGDIVAFMLLWCKGLPITSEVLKQKVDFKKMGFSDPYPAPASISTLTYMTTSEDELPKVEYINPYD